jgi:subtilisin-like proprotein convertase family protein
MRQTLLLSILVVLYCGYSGAQSNFYYHSNQHLNTTAPGGASATETQRDATGNLYRSGNFSGSTDFDFGPGVSNLSTNDFYAKFIAKYSASGAFVWARKIEPSQTGGDLLLYGLCVDNTGALIIYGAVLGTVDMDPGTGTFFITEVNQDNGYPPGDYDPFVAKYDTNGNLLWAWVIGAAFPECGQGCVDFKITDVEVDASNNLFVLGDFQNNIYFDFDFDPTGGTAFLPQNGSTDVFLAKYTSGGEYIKAVNLGGHIDDHPGSLQMTSGGTVTVTGGFAGTGDFDPGSGTSMMSSNGPNLDVFAARYTAANLDYVWAVGGDGSLDENELYGDFKEDASGNLYINSSIRGPYTADFDPGAGVFNITGQGNGDIVNVKLDSSGNFIWAKHLASSSYEGVLDVRLDEDQNPWFLFRFYGDLDIDPGTGSTVLTSNGVGSAVVKYTQEGELSNQTFDFSGTSVQHYLELTHIYFYDNDTLLINGRLKGTADTDPGVGVENVTSSSDVIGTNVLVKMTTSQLSVLPGNQNVSSPAGSTTFAITSNVSWTATSPTSWVTITPTSGSNNGTITVNYTANTGDIRIATIHVTSGGQTRTVTVTQASGLMCEAFMSTDVPKIIDPNSSNTIYSTLTIPSGAEIVDLDVIDLNISHGWINDLTTKLNSPANTERSLFYEICSNGYAQSTNADFDDEVNGVPGANCPTVLQGPYKPVQSFSAYDGEQSGGIWTLSIFDISPQIGGTLHSWGLKVCYANESGNIVTNTLNDGPGSLRYVIAHATAGDSIFFDPGLQDSTIIILPPVISIATDLIFYAPLADSIRIASVSPRIQALPHLFTITPTADVVINGLILEGGFGPDGSCVLNQGSLTLKDMHVDDANVSGILSTVKNVAGSQLTVVNAVRIK